MSAPEDAREALQATADFLCKVPFASKHLLFVATAFHDYLDGKHGTVDQALGLRLGRGKYERPEKQAHIEMICKAFRDLDRLPFKTVAELNGYAAKEFKVLFDRYKYHAIEAMADRLAKELNDDNRGGA